MANKEAIINFKIDPAIKELFKEVCEENFTNPSHELRKFVYEKVREHNSKC